MSDESYSADCKAKLNELKTIIEYFQDIPKRYKHVYIESKCDHNPYTICLRCYGISCVNEGVREYVEHLRNVENYLSELANVSWMPEAIKEIEEYANEWRDSRANKIFVIILDIIERHRNGSGK